MIQSFFPFLVHLVHTKMIYQTLHCYLFIVGHFGQQQCVILIENHLSLYLWVLQPFILETNILHTKSFPKPHKVQQWLPNVLHLQPPLPPRRTCAYFTNPCKSAQCLLDFQRFSFKLLRPMHTFKTFYQTQNL